MGRDGEAEGEAATAAAASTSTTAIVVYCPPLRWRYGSNGNGSGGLTVEALAASWRAALEQLVATQRQRRSLAAANATAAVQLQNLPLEVLLRVASYADARSLARFAMTCRTGRDVVLVDSLWGPLLLLDWGCRPTDFRDPIPLARQLYAAMEQSFRKLVVGPRGFSARRAF